MKNLFNIIYYFFIGAICLIAVLLLVSTFPITGNFKVLTVLSGSMEPAVKTGSVVVVKPAAAYRAGDIITFGEISRTKTPTTHRIYEIRSENGVNIFTTKGDANNAPDARDIRQNEIAGKVMFSVPYLGYAISAAKKPIGFILIIVIPALLLIFDEFKKIWGEVKKIRAKKAEAGSKK